MNFHLSYAAVFSGIWSIDPGHHLNDLFFFLPGTLFEDLDDFLTLAVREHL